MSKPKRAGRSQQNPQSRGGNNTRSQSIPARIVGGIAKAGKIAGGIASAGKGLLELVELIKQHPEWYTHYDTHNLIAMNLAFKQNVEYKPTIQSQSAPGGGYNYSHVAMPAIASVRVALTLPQGDQEGWKTGIRLLFQQIRTANAGRINFRVQDLEKYVFNVRQLHAVNAWLKRLYNLTYTFRSTNAAIPRQMIISMSVDFEDIMSNAAPLIMYCQRFAEQCRVSFPLTTDLYSRAQWMFGNVFVDSDSHKPAFYIPTFESANGTFNGVQYFDEDEELVWAVNQAWVGKQNHLLTYEEITAACDEFKTNMLDNSLMSVIAGDIIKAFGDKAFASWPSPEIDEGAACIYDESALSQWQNATVLSVANMAGTPLTNTAAGQGGNSTARYTLEIDSESGWGSGELTLAWPDNVSNLVNADLLISRYNQYLLNWHDNTIDAGHVMSITRLVASGASLYVSAGNIVNFSIFGTEVVVGLWAMFQVASTQSVNQAPLPEDVLAYPIAGYLYINATTSGASTISAELTTVAFFWANYDWAPRYGVLVRQDSSGTPSVPNIILTSREVLDWDVFAVVDELNLALYYSYGNQSLLYAGSSQNQANSKVYRKAQKGKNDQEKKVDGNSNSSEPTRLESDKA